MSTEIENMPPLWAASLPEHRILGDVNKRGDSKISIDLGSRQSMGYNQLLPVPDALTSLVSQTWDYEPDSPFPFFLWGGSGHFVTATENRLREQ